MGDGGRETTFAWHEVISSCVYLRKLLQGLKKIKRRLSCAFRVYLKCLTLTSLSIWICSYRQWFIDQRGSKAFQKGGVEKKYQEDQQLRNSHGYSFWQLFRLGRAFFMTALLTLTTSMSWLDGDGTSSEGRILAGSAETDGAATALLLPAAWEEALYPVIKMAGVQADPHTPSSAEEMHLRSSG